MRHVGKKPPIRKIIARVNDSNLLTVLQPNIHKRYFETPDKKRYPDARLEEVTIHDIQTGQPSLSLVKFGDIRSDRKGVTMSAAQFRKHVHNKIMAPQDVGVRSTSPKRGTRVRIFLSCGGPTCGGMPELYCSCTCPCPFKTPFPTQRPARSQPPAPILARSARRNLDVSYSRILVHTRGYAC